MKVIKKRIIVFILCFTLFTCGFVHTDPVQEVKASATVTAISFIILGLTAIGFYYYSQASASSLQNDIEIYASEHDTTSASFLNAFQSVVVDVAKNAVKYTAAQVYLLKDFASSLMNKNKVSNVPITSSTLRFIPLYGYPCLIKLEAGQTFTVELFNGSDSNEKITYHCSVVSCTGDCYIGFVSYMYSPLSDYKTGLFSWYHLFPLGGSATINFYSNSNTTDVVTTYITSSTSRFNFVSGLTSKLGSSQFNYCKVNGNYFTNLFYDYANDSIYTAAYFNSVWPSRFGYNSNTNTYEGLTLPSYSVDKTVFDNIASDKDLVITSPDVIDKAVDNAIVRNPSSTSVTADDVAAAIDSTAVGVIDPAAEDEEDRVIAPPISLDDDLSISQDSAITDTVVEDLDIGDPVPPPDPPPVIPEIDSALAAKFPFSIFSDFILIMSIFDEDPEAPVFNLGFTALGRDFQFTIDLSAFNSVASVVRTMELLAFIVGIIFVTIKFMQGGSD